MNTPPTLFCLDFPPDPARAGCAFRQWLNHPTGRTQNRNHLPLSNEPTLLGRVRTLSPENSASSSSLFHALGHWISPAFGPETSLKRLETTLKWLETRLKRS